VSGPLLVLAIVLAAGMLAGQLCVRIGVPSVTGQILVGILLGPSVIGVFDLEAVHRLVPVTDFALGLIAVTIGSHLHFTRLLVAKRRLFFLLFFESLVTPALVAVSVFALFDVGWQMTALLAAISVSTAPATVVALVREARAKGVFVRTLMAAVALNNIACLTLFEIAYSAVRADFTAQVPTVQTLLVAPFIQVAGSVGVGVAVGLGLIAATVRMYRTDLLSTSSLVAILLTVGLGRSIGGSPLLACLAMGLVLANVTPDKEEIGHRVFRNFDVAIMAVFFTMAGAELDFGYLVPAGLMAAVMVVARILGKLISARWAMSLAGAPENLGKYLGLALVPQAGVAVGLLLLVRDDPLFADISGLLLAVGLTAVTAAELIGPLTARWALAKSGDANKDRARLIDFLQEENIVTNLQAPDIGAALEQLTSLLWASHRLDPEAKEKFVEQVLERERNASSYLGEGLAIPHGELPQGEEILGVMGISPDGVPTDDPQLDDRIFCFVLLASPPGRRDQHLRVLAAFARAIGSDRNIRIQLYEAGSPAHAYNILHADEAEGFNYFLDDDPYQSRQPA